MGNKNSTRNSPPSYEEIKDKCIMQSFATDAYNNKITPDELSDNQITFEEIKNKYPNGIDGVTFKKYFKDQHFSINNKPIDSACNGKFLYISNLNNIGYQLKAFGGIPEERFNILTKIDITPECVLNLVGNDLNVFKMTILDGIYKDCTTIFDKPFLCKTLANTIPEIIKFTEFDNKDIAHIALKKNGMLLEFVKSKTKELCLIALEQNIQAYKFCDKFKNDSDIVNIAIADETNMSDIIKNNKLTIELCKKIPTETIISNGHIINLISENSKNCVTFKKILYDLIKIDPFVISKIETQDAEMCSYAYLLNNGVIPFIKLDLKQQEIDKCKAIFIETKMI